MPPEKAIDWIVRITDQPLAVFAIGFVVMTLAAGVGALVGRVRGIEAEAREHFGVVRSATLTLLALIVGFSFSMALIRYDERKSDEEAEANAIGLEYLRAELLPVNEAGQVRTLLLDYLDLRIAFYRERDEASLRRIHADTARTEFALWAIVRGIAQAQATPVTALAVTGIGEVLRTQSRTRAAWWNRIPTGAWCLMVTMALCANLLVGLGARWTRSDLALALVLPFVLAVAFLLIADIDSPRGGSIHVDPDNLVRMAHALRAQ